MMMDCVISEGEFAINEENYCVLLYSAFITLREKKVLRAKCACPAGIEGHCNHVAALLFFLE